MDPLYALTLCNFVWPTEQVYRRLDEAGQNRTGAIIAPPWRSANLAMSLAALASSMMMLFVLVRLVLDTASTRYSFECSGWISALRRLSSASRLHHLNAWLRQNVCHASTDTASNTGKTQRATQSRFCVAVSTFAATKQHSTSANR